MSTANPSPTDSRHISSLSFMTAKDYVRSKLHDVIRIRRIGNGLEPGFKISVFTGDLNKELHSAKIAEPNLAIKGTGCVHYEDEQLRFRAGVGGGPEHSSLYVVVQWGEGKE